MTASSLLPERLTSKTAKEAGSPNYHRRAFLHPVNLGFLLAVGIAAMILGGSGGWQTLTLLFGGAAELLYLGLVPRSRRFRRMVRAEREEREPLSRRERVAELSRENQKRVLGVERLSDAVRTNYRQVNDAAQGLLESHLRKLDDLLEAHLEMLYLRERYRTVASDTTREEVSTARRELEDQIEQASERVRPIRERQLSILEKRLDRYDAAEEQMEVLDAQVDTIEEVVRYVHEESLTLTDPGEITLQLDTLVSEVEETRESVQELEQLFSGRSVPELGVSGGSDE